MQSGHDVDIAKVRCELGKEVEDTLKERVYIRDSIFPWWQHTMH